MSTIDIRDLNTSPVHQVTFADKNSGTAHAVSVEKDVCGANGRIRINGQIGPQNYLYVNGKKEAEDLIKALQFGIEAGWVN